MSTISQNRKIKNFMREYIFLKINQVKKIKGFKFSNKE